jgi:pimeloyl-ACP methyl ester carboxylesterase
MALCSIEVVMDSAHHISDGIRYLERPGSGRVLVFLHGIGSNAGSFARLWPALPAEWRLIAWNAPGYGGSAPLAPEWPLASHYATALAALLDRLGIRRCTLVGHSLGTLIAAAFARSTPQRLQAMVLAACAEGHGGMPGAALSPAAQGRMDDLVALGPAEFASKRAPRLLFRPEADPELCDFVTRGMAAVTMPGYGQAVRMLASGQLCADLAGVTVPTGVIVGSEDVVTPPAAARRAHAALPAACRGPYIELPAAGHALYQQAPVAFARALETCLSETACLQAQQEYPA